MDHITFLVAVVIVTALAFDFTNGFHDTANAMATSIATGALAPRTAVLISGVLNVAGAFLSTEVAKTISGGIVDDTLVSPGMIFAGLVGAILWNLLTWLVGLPSSSSHALFGGLIGAVWVGAGSHGVNFDKVVEKVLVPAVASPIVAGVAALIATYLAYRLTDRARKDSVTKGFRIGQIASASLVSLAHGTNDAQKTMGVITLTLISAGALGHDAGPPLWVIASAGLAIGLGTYLGGWRIIRTMGKGLTEIQSPQGFAAETASTTVILTSAHLGFALSTTQVASGSILGAGLGRRLAEVRWGVAGRMAIAWMVTLPAAALVGGLAASVVQNGGDIGTAVVAAVGAALAAGIVLVSRRNPVHAHNVNDAHEVGIRTEPPAKVGAAA
ncbi:phosphate transporter [Streptomyces violarus]|uniref:Phosphate transporter n=1 Tax=Streptomyces violarus TaxID=67380 RepID=A0A7W5F0T1_9ACTN|nr:MULTISPECIES: inorganic phosphate transporter [Streptomyces]MBB3075814.1 PiT family inorganic phosphate transporter [Streptomyces violarus]WRT98660.1 inorganic phosphate transporter [Streptomyces sp. CGMCC 4.1772]GHD09796.1 phosphate transporter [Streptomyces violarus]